MISSFPGYTAALGHRAVAGGVSICVCVVAITAVGLESRGCGPRFQLCPSTVHNDSWAFLNLCTRTRAQYLMRNVSFSPRITL